MDKSGHQTRADGLLPGVNDRYGYWPFALAGGVILGTAGLLIFKMIRLLRRTKAVWIRFRSPDSSAGRRDAGLERCTHAAKIGEKLENANRIGTNCPQVPLERSGGFVASSRPKLRGPMRCRTIYFSQLLIPNMKISLGGASSMKSKPVASSSMLIGCCNTEPVIARFGLAPGTFVVRSDAHYRSRRVLLKPPGRIRTQGQNEHQQQAEPGAKDSFRQPRYTIQSRAAGGPSSRAALTDKKRSYLIEPYSNLASNCVIGKRASQLRGAGGSI